MKKGLIVYSMFDGISCGAQALKDLNIKVDEYCASEINKKAINVAKKNHPTLIELGNILNVSAKGKHVDLLIGGSPCQGFSFAGKQLNFSDPRSKLFFEFVRIYNEAKETNPDIKFLLENVKMKQEFQNVISEALGVKPIAINSKLVSAQKRQRLYWTNIGGGQIEQPEDRGILLKDILQTGVDEKYFLTGKRLENWIKNSPVRIKKCFSSLDADKAICMTARQYANWYGNHVTENGRVRQLTVTECERLQGLPDGYTDCVEDVHAYEALGNGWNLPTIKHIIKNL